MIQGVIAASFTVYAYAQSAKFLGAARAAVFPAAVAPVALVLGAVVLRSIPTFQQDIAVAVAMTGLVAAVGIWPHPKPLGAPSNATGRFHDAGCPPSVMSWFDCSVSMKTRRSGSLLSRRYTNWRSSGTKRSCTRINRTRGGGRSMLVVHDGDADARRHQAQHRAFIRLFLDHEGRQAARAARCHHVYRNMPGKLLPRKSDERKPFEILEARIGLDTVRPGRRHGDDHAPGTDGMRGAGFGRPIREVHEAGVKVAFVHQCQLPRRVRRHELHADFPVCGREGLERRRYRALPRRDLEVTQLQQSGLTGRDAPRPVARGSEHLDNARDIGLVGATRRIQAHSAREALEELDTQLPLQLLRDTAGWAICSRSEARRIFSVWAIIRK